MRVFRRELIELRQNGVRSTVHVHWVGFHTHLAPVSGKRLDLVKKNDARPCGRFLSQNSAKKVRYSLLGLAVRRAGKRVGINLNEGERSS